MNDGIKIIEFSVDNYPGMVHIRPIKTGDILYVLPDKRDPVFSVGDIYPKYNNHFIVHKAFYEPKHWWEFWKKKVPIGYVIMYYEGELCIIKED